MGSWTASYSAGGSANSWNYWSQAYGARGQSSNTWMESPPPPEPAGGTKAAKRPEDRLQVFVGVQAAALRGVFFVHEARDLCFEAQGCLLCCEAPGNLCSLLKMLHG